MLRPMNEQSEAPLMLSVSGARGIVGKTMTPGVAGRFARSFGLMIGEQYEGDARPLLVLGRDSRPSGGELAEAVAASLASVGCDIVDLDSLSPLRELLPQLFRDPLEFESGGRLLDSQALRLQSACHFRRRQRPQRHLATEDGHAVNGPPRPIHPLRDVEHE